MPEDLGLGGDVERRRRLVAQQQPGLDGEGAGDHHPLQHAAGQLVRVLAQVPLGVVEAHRAEQLESPGAGSAGRPAVVAARATR